MGRILIADDHDALRRGLVRALTAVGNDVDEAPDGNAAIERLRSGHFDVVVADVTMGGSDGLEVLRTAKALHPSTAVILMTALASVATAVEAMKSGAFDFVQKPFEIEEIEAKVEAALASRHTAHDRSRSTRAHAGTSASKAANGCQAPTATAARRTVRGPAAG